VKWPGPAQSNPLLLTTGKFRRPPLEKTFFNAQLFAPVPQNRRSFTGTIYVSLWQGQVRVTLLVEDFHVRPRA